MHAADAPWAAFVEELCSNCQLPNKLRGRSKAKWIASAYTGWWSGLTAESHRALPAIDRGFETTCVKRLQFTALRTRQVSNGSASTSGSSTPICVVVVRVRQSKPILEPLEVFAPLPLVLAGEPRALTLLKPLQLVQQLIVIALVTEGATAPHGAGNLPRKQLHHIVSELQRHKTRQ